MAILELSPLKRNWSWWFLDLIENSRSNSWEDRLKKIYTFNTIQEFWAVHEALRPPSRLYKMCDYSVFRDGIEPKWAADEKGGRWQILIDKSRSSNDLDKIWLEILMAMIGEQFGDEMESICGLVCNVRGRGSKISLWTKDCNDDETNLRIGKILKEKLLSASKDLPRPLFDVIRYEDHQTCRIKKSSVVKAKHSLYSTEQVISP